jgi:hypothetical protein
MNDHNMFRTAILSNHTAGLGEIGGYTCVPGCRCNRTVSDRRRGRRSRTRTSKSFKFSPSNQITTRSIRTWRVASTSRRSHAEIQDRGRRRACVYTCRTLWEGSWGRQWWQRAAAQSAQKWFLSFLRSAGCAAHASKNSSDSRPRSYCGAPRTAVGSCMAAPAAGPSPAYGGRTRWRGE